MFRIGRGLIEQANRDYTYIDHWTFGGGTAMMIQIDHRESHDVDIFLPDPQLLPYLDPQRHDFSFEIAPTGYGGDGTGFLKISFDKGEVDFIIGHEMTRTPAVLEDIEGGPVLLETIPEIITKKVVYRGRSFKPRDIFDVAAASEKYASEIVDALKDYPKEVTYTIDSIDRLNPDFINATIDQLMIRDKFRGIASTAVERAKDLFKAV